MFLNCKIFATSGKNRSFYFTDDYGDNVQCRINNVTLTDVQKNTEKELRNPKLAESFSPEQLEEARKHSYYALEQCCPKGMCYIDIEYEAKIMTWYSIPNNT